MIWPGDGISGGEKFRCLVQNIKYGLMLIGHCPFTNKGMLLLNLKLYKYPYFYFTKFAELI